MAVFVSDAGWDLRAGSLSGQDINVTGSGAADSRWNAGYHCRELELLSPCVAWVVLTEGWGINSCLPLFKHCFQIYSLKSTPINEHNDGSQQWKTYPNTQVQIRATGRKRTFLDLVTLRGTSKAVASSGTWGRGVTNLHPSTWLGFLLDSRVHRILEQLC